MCGYICAHAQADVLLAAEGKRAPLLPPDHLPPVLKASYWRASGQMAPSQLRQEKQQEQQGGRGSEDGYPLPPSLAWADAVKAMSDASLYVILDCR